MVTLAGAAAFGFWSAERAQDASARATGDTHRPARNPRLVVDCFMLSTKRE
jgi:hypothetical protein